MQTRPYGAGGDCVSLIGLGGIVVANMDQQEANRIVRDAFDRGVTYYDVAPTYADAEDRLGPALNGLRDHVFLACKTEKRIKSEADAALATSLRKLRTDHFDLYQMHGLQSIDDARACFAPGGAMETLIEAKTKGLTRYLGFSSHSVEAALYCFEQFRFDSVLFPLSYPAYYVGNFGPQVIEAAQASGATVLALKAMARGPWPEGSHRPYPKCWYQPFDAPDDAETALRWALTLPIGAAVPPGDPGLFEVALQIAERFTPMSQAEVSLVSEMAAAQKPLFVHT